MIGLNEQKENDFNSIQQSKTKKLPKEKGLNISDPRYDSMACFPQSLLHKNKDMRIHHMPCDENSFGRMLVRDKH